VEKKALRFMAYGPVDINNFVSNPAILSEHSFIKLLEIT
jgi:hypothetical protein